MTPTFAPLRLAARRSALPAALAVLAIAALALALAPAPASAALPRDFVGLSGFGLPTGGQLHRVDGARVQSYRVLMSWRQIEPRAPYIAQSAEAASRYKCPKGTRKTTVARLRVHCYRWSAYDRTLSAAASRGIRVMPLLAGSPSWVARDPWTPPKAVSSRRAFNDYARSLADRYGPNGYYWNGRNISKGYRPLYLQIWNEPNTNVYWAGAPNAAEYARLLKGASDAANAGDSAVAIVTGGMTYPPSGRGIDPRTFLRGMFRANPKIGDEFSAVGLHPYARTPSLVVEAIRAMRVGMNRMRTYKRIYVTEIGWSSAKPNGRLQVGDKQDDYLRELFYRLLGRGGYASAAERYNVRGAIWFALQDINDRNLTWSKTTGLLDTRGRAKPAWWRLRQVTGAG